MEIEVAIDSSLLVALILHRFALPEDIKNFQKMK